MAVVATIVILMLLLEIVFLCDGCVDDDGTDAGADIGG